MKYRQLAIWIVIATLSVLFGTYFWPTKYAYYAPNGQTYSFAQLIRVNRFNGQTQVWSIVTNDWSPLPKPVTPMVNATPKPPALTGNAADDVHPDRRTLTWYTREELLKMMPDEKDQSLNHVTTLDEMFSNKKEFYWPDDKLRPNVDLDEKIYSWNDVNEVMKQRLKASATQPAK